MFSTGKIDIYKKNIEKTAAGRPIESIKYYKSVFYEEINFSVTEYYAAKQAEVKAVKRIRIRQDRELSPREHVILVDKEQYDIGRFFHGLCNGVPITDMTLEAAAALYRIIR